MKLAIIAALSLDRRRGRVVGDIVPADQAIAAVKAAIAADKAPDPTLPLLGVFALDSCLRSHRFKPTPEEIAAAGTLIESGSPDELNALLAANERMQAEIDEAKVQYPPMLDELEKTRGANLELKAQLEAGKALADGFNQRLAALESDSRLAIDRAAAAAAERDQALEQAATDKAAADAAINRVSELEKQLATKTKK